MDSLIVLRKPLKKTQLEPKFATPKKIKKAVEPISPNLALGEESDERPISFVKLYKDLCVENSIHGTDRVHASSPTRVRMCLPAHVYPNSASVDLNAYVDVNSPATVCPVPQLEWPPGHLHVNTPESCMESSRSDASLVTHYLGTDVECTGVSYVVPPPSSARAELILELDYDTTSKDSGFC